MSTRQKLVYGAWMLTVVVSVVTAVSYQALSSTLLSADYMSRQLRQSEISDVIRRETITSNVSQRVQMIAPDNKLIDDTLIESVIQEAVSETDTASIVYPALDATYAWLRGTDSSLGFTVDTSTIVEKLTTTFESRIAQKIAGYDACRDILLAPREALLYEQCVPIYLSESTAVTSVSDSLRSTLQSDPRVTVAVSQQQLGVYAYLPTFLKLFGYASAVSVAIIVLSIGLLLLRYTRQRGVALSLSLGLGALVLWSTAYYLSVLDTSWATPYELLADRVRTDLGNELSTHALFVFVAGFFGMALQLPWKKYKQRIHRG